MFFLFFVCFPVLSNRCLIQLLLCSYFVVCALQWESRKTLLLPDGVIEQGSFTFKSVDRH